MFQGGRHSNQHGILTLTSLNGLLPRPEYQLSADIHSHKAGTKSPHKLALLNQSATRLKTTDPDNNDHCIQPLAPHPSRP